MFCKRIRIILFVIIFAIMLDHVNIVQSDNANRRLSRLSRSQLYEAVVKCTEAKNQPDSNFYNVVKERWNKLQNELFDNLQTSGQISIGQQVDVPINNPQTVQADDNYLRILSDPQTEFVHSRPITIKSNYDKFMERLLNVGTDNSVYDEFPSVSDDVQPVQTNTDLTLSLVEDGLDMDNTFDNDHVKNNLCSKLIDDKNNEAAIGEVLDSSYPSVLTKAIETTMSMPCLSNSNLFANVAKEMNTTVLELAEKLIAMPCEEKRALERNPKLQALLTEQCEKAGKEAMDTEEKEKPKKEKEPKGKVDDAADCPAKTVDEKTEEKEKSKKEKEPKGKVEDAADCPDKTVDDDASTDKDESTDSEPNTDAEVDETSTAQNISGVLEKVLNKLECLQCTPNDTTEASDGSPEGSPCDLCGSWHSEDMGIRIDLTVGRSKGHQLSDVENGNKPLKITVKERVPPKPKRLITPDWKFIGSCLEERGGPFYMYGQQQSERLISMFAGFCRSCNGLDTIFGAWTFVYPSKDCQDITASIEHRADIFRRFQLNDKRQQRMKNVLYNKNAKTDDDDECPRRSHRKAKKSARVQK